MLKAAKAEAAVIAWMRHQTTGYDGMVIPRIKGKRREVRRMLADARSRSLVSNFAEQWLYLRNLASTTPDMRHLRAE